MRELSLIAAMALLTGCGNRDSGDEPSPNANMGTPSLNQANTTAPSKPAAEVDNATANGAEGTASPCLMQGDERVDVSPIRAVGTEPFWSARVEGRCVTYSTPEDQQGTRVWGRYSAGPNGSGAWIGQLGGKTFELRTRPEAGCSDGMSDKSYPMAVELTVGGEQRKGCAEPL